MSDIYIRDLENDLTYDSSTGSYVLTSSIVTEYTLTIIPTPSDATVTLTAEGYTQSGNSITVPEGLTVTYSVVKPGYVQKSDSVVVDSDITLNITLDLLEVDPIDESTTVKELEVNSTVYDIVGKGILDQNSKTTQTKWVGTKAEYKALGVYADYCTYIITDDSADSQSDEVGAIAEEVNTLKGYDYVVDWQAPTSANGYTWYRKYKSGWVEQGGIKTIPSRTNSGSSSTSVTFPVSMSDTNYTGQISYQSGGSYYAECMLTLTNRKTTGVSLEFYMNASGTTAAFLVGWQVSGMAA